VGSVRNGPASAVVKIAWRLRTVPRAVNTCHGGDVCLRWSTGGGRLALTGVYDAILSLRTVGAV
jgi:hypothetical protein